MESRRKGGGGNFFQLWGGEIMNTVDVAKREKRGQHHVVPYHVEWGESFWSSHFQQSVGVLSHYSRKGEQTKKT